MKNNNAKKSFQFVCIPSIPVYISIVAEYYNNKENFFVVAYNGHVKYS